MSGYNEVFAHFVSDETNEYKLKVKKSKKNGGDGTVTSSDGYIDCGDICFHTYYKDTVVTLSAAANGQLHLPGLEARHTQLHWHWLMHSKTG